MPKKIKDKTREDMLVDMLNRQYAKGNIKDEAQIKKYKNKLTDEAKEKHEQNKNKNKEE